MSFLRYVHPLFHRRGSMEACFICRIVWRRMLDEPGMVEELEQGMADIEAGRFYRWSDVRREFATTTTTSGGPIRPFRWPEPDEPPTLDVQNHVGD